MLKRISAIFTAPKQQYHYGRVSTVRKDKNFYSLRVGSIPDPDKSKYRGARPVTIPQVIKLLKRKEIKKSDEVTVAIYAIWYLNGDKFQWSGFHIPYQDLLQRLEHAQKIGETMNEVVHDIMSLVNPGPELVMAWDVRPA